MKKKPKLVEEFLTFIKRGSVIDMTVGIIVGSAFTAIVNSFVKDIISPLIGLLTSGINLANNSIVLRKATDTRDALTLNYGSFLNAIINFLIVSFVVFNMIKLINLTRDKLSKSEPAPEPEKPSLSDEAELLTEIRDLLKNSK